MIFRLTSSSLAGTSRKLVAVGAPRLASMLSTIRAEAPRSGSAAPHSLAGIAGAAGPGGAGAGTGLGGGRGAAGGGRGRGRRRGGHRLGRRRGRGGRGGRRGRRGRRDGGNLAARAQLVAVVGEEVAPRLAHRARVGEVPLVHVVDEPGVGSERVRGR